VKVLKKFYLINVGSTNQKVDNVRNNTVVIVDITPVESIILIGIRHTAELYYLILFSGKIDPANP